MCDMPEDTNRAQPIPPQGEFHIRGRALSSDRRRETSYERRNRYYAEDPSPNYDDRRSPSPPARRYNDRDAPRSPTNYRSRSRSRRRSPSQERPPSRGKPSKEIMMEGLGLHLTENDVR